MPKTSPRAAVAADLFKLSEKAAAFRSEVRRAIRLIDREATINDLTVDDLLDEVDHVETFLFEAGQAVERGTLPIEERGQDPRPLFDPPSRPVVEPAPKSQPGDEGDPPTKLADADPAWDVFHRQAGNKPPAWVCRVWAEKSGDAFQEAMNAFDQSKFEDKFDVHPASKAWDPWVARAGGERLVRTDWGVARMATREPIHRETPDPIEETLESAAPADPEPGRGDDWRSFLPGDLDVHPMTRASLRDFPTVGHVSDWLDGLDETAPVIPGTFGALGREKREEIRAAIDRLKAPKAAPGIGEPGFDWCSLHPPKKEAVPTENKTAKAKRARKPKKATVRACRGCGCTDDDCRQCIEKTGEPCHWVEADLCSACWAGPLKLENGPAPTGPAAGAVHSYDVYLPALGEHERSPLGSIVAPSLAAAIAEAPARFAGELNGSPALEVAPAPTCLDGSAASRPPVEIKECVACGERWPASEGVGCPRCVHGPAEVAPKEERANDGITHFEAEAEGARREPLPGQRSFLEDGTEPVSAEDDPAVRAGMAWWEYPPAMIPNLTHIGVDALVDAGVVNAGQAWHLLETGELATQTGMTVMMAKGIEAAIIGLRHEKGDPAPFTVPAEDPAFGLAPPQAKPKKPRKSPQKTFVARYLPDGEEGEAIELGEFSARNLDEARTIGPGIYAGHEAMVDGEPRPIDPAYIEVSPAPAKTASPRPKNLVNRPSWDVKLIQGAVSRLACRLRGPADADEAERVAADLYGPIDGARWKVHVAMPGNDAEVREAGGSKPIGGGIDAAFVVKPAVYEEEAAGVA